MSVAEYYERAKHNHPEVLEAWVQRVLDNPDHVTAQPDGRIRYYGYIDEAGKWLRVIVEDDEVLNRFFDRGALRRWGRP